MADDDRPSYDPARPAPPSREPPLRNTAPQSAYTNRQALTGAVIAIVGMALTIGVALVLV